MVYSYNIIAFSHLTGTNQQFSNMNSNNVTNVSLMTNTSPTKVFKTTNENVSEWLSAELDHPTRDNEFGKLVFSRTSKL